MQIVCSKCHAEFEAPYWQWGLKRICPSCYNLITITQDVIRSVGSFMYDTSYLNFLGYITYPYYQDKILPLIHDWLGYELVQAETGPQFRDAEGHLHDAEEVHTKIQQNSSWQRSLYGAAYPLTH